MFNEIIYVRIKVQRYHEKLDPKIWDFDWIWTNPESIYV